MLRRNNLSEVLLPDEVLTDGFSSAVTVVLIIRFCSSALNAAFKKVSFNHMLKEHVSHVTLLNDVLYC